MPEPLPVPRGPAKTIRYFWEDLQVGTTRELGSVQPTQEQIKAFALQFDPQPFHVDEVAARDSLFGGLCASGWHTCAMAMRLMVDGFLNESASLGSPGLESVKWHKPVFPGDTLSLSQAVLESRPMATRADVGLVRTAWLMVNQHGEKVLTMDGYGMFRRRTPAGE
jgi:acyl dehydratase